MTENKIQVGVNLDPPTVARLDRIGAAYGLSRSAVARLLITSTIGLTDENLRRLIVPPEPAAVATLETPSGVVYEFSMSPEAVGALTGRVREPFTEPTYECRQTDACLCPDCRGRKFGYDRP
jgi:hypothetical protein